MPVFIFSLGFGFVISTVFSGTRNLMLQYIAVFLSYGGIKPSSFTGYSILVASSLLTYTFIALLFVQFADLKKRFPQKIPGIFAISVGILLQILYNVIFFVSTQIEGGGATFVVLSYSFVLTVPASVLIFVGVVKALLSVDPRRKN